MTIITTYAIYLAISIVFTTAVGYKLHKSGRLFLIDSFEGDKAKADAVNSLLITGFYLVNFGFVLLFLAVGTRPESDLASVEYLATKLGIVLVVLGGMHFFNMRNIAKMRSKAQRKVANAST